MLDNYLAVELYAGKMHVGSGVFNDFNSIMDWVKEDGGFADKVVIVDTKTNKKYVIKVKEVK